MSRLLLSLFAVLLLTAANCEPPPDPPEGGTEYCKGVDYTIWDQVAGVINTIIGGEESSTRRATVRVRFGNGYCSGVVIGPHTILTAGHCGPRETLHRADFQPFEGNVTFLTDRKLVHPDYLRYLSSGNQDMEARKSDLMLLFFDEELPGPYVGDSFYNMALADRCQGLIAQGYGRHEESGLQLREAKYLVNRYNDPKLISTYKTPEGRICFGDSGGPLYADVENADGSHVLLLAGITTTTMSQDCLLGGTHVRMSTESANGFREWVLANEEK